MRRVLPLLPLGLLLGLEACVFDPLGVAHRNPGEFPAGSGEILPALLIAAAAITLLVVALGALCPRRHQDRLRALLLTIALLLWAQRSFLLPDYGVFDGRGLRSDSIGSLPALDFLVWAAAVALALRYAKTVARQATFLAIALLVLQSGVTVTRLAGGDVQGLSGSAPGQSRPPEEIFRWSSGQNVLHVILDSFQSDVFAEVVEEEGWADELDGFRFYRENMGVAISTSYSVPAALSGETYDGEEPFSRYFQRAMSERGFPNRLDEAGFVVNLIPHLPMHGTRHDHYFTAPVVWGASRGQRVLRAAALAADVSFFRHAPHLLRGWVHAEGDWRLSRLVGEAPSARSFHQKAFLRDYVDALEVDGPEPRYHFLHLMPPHPPYVTLADGSYAGQVLESTRENFRHEARAILRIFLELLDRMRREGVYDSSLVVLHGDHGSRFAPVVDGRQRSLPVERVPALLAIKPPGATGPLRSEESWSSLSDLPATVMETLGLDHDYPGRNLLELPVGPRGGRHFFVVDDPEAESPTVTSYRVEGSIFDPASWEIESSREIERTYAHYRWGDTIQFGVGGNAQDYQGRGWSQPSRRAEWTNGPRAELHLRIDPAPDDMLLEVVLRPFLLEGHVERQRVELLLDDRRVAELVADSQGYSMLRSRIPREELDTEELTLTFLLPDCASPVELGAGGDRRRLGISVGQVRLRPIP